MHHLVVAIAEDDPDHLDLIRLIVESLAGACSIIAATTCAEILTLTAGKKPNLILLDLRIPGDGFACVQQLKANPATRAIPVIAITAMSLDRDVVIAAGFDDYIQKPFDVDALASKVRAYLEPGLSSPG